MFSDRVQPMTAYEITGLFIYPIKGCAGHRVDAAAMTERGFENDRLYMVVDPDGMFITQRQIPSLCLVSPSLINGGLRLQSPSQPQIDVPLRQGGDLKAVTIWRDTCIAVDQGQAAADWLSSFLGTECRLMRMSDEHPRQVHQDYGQPEDIVSFADGFPFLITNEASLDDLNSKLKEPVPMDRFRPSIVVRGASAFEEDNWVSLHSESTNVDIVKPCARCVVTTTDQKTAARGVEPLKTLATYRKVDGNQILFGQNAIPRRVGTMRVGEMAHITIKG
jgi:uncharacterized protein YcbX